MFRNLISFHFKCFVFAFHYRFVSCSFVFRINFLCVIVISYLIFVSCLIMFFIEFLFVSRSVTGVQTCALPIFILFYFIKSLSCFVLIIYFVFISCLIVKYHIVSFRVVSYFSYFVYVKCRFIYLIICCN